MHHLRHSIWTPLNIHDAWEFFSNPDNLAKLTPEEYRMSIEFNRSVPLHEGSVIRIKVKPLPFFTTGWKSIITYINAPHSFTDIQKSGPFKKWNHTHSFVEENDGTRIIDEVEYALPLGPLGKLVHGLFVEKQLNGLFEFREKKLKELFQF